MRYPIIERSTSKCLRILRECARHIHSRRFDAINMVLINSRIFVDFVSFSRGSYPQARRLPKSRRVEPHRGPPTPRSTRLLATGHPHLARPSKESPGCCWWEESSKYHAYCWRAAAEIVATSTWVIFVSGMCAICGGEIARKFQVSSKKGQHFRTARPCLKVRQKRTGWGCPKVLSLLW